MRDGLLEVGHALAERQALRQLDKPDQVAATATAVAVEQILRGIDVERGPGLAMERTQAHKLPWGCRAASRPATAPQVIQQRKTPFELFQVLGHAWSIKSGRPANQRDVVCKMPSGGVACAGSLAG